MKELSLDNYKTKVKICGITKPENISYVNQACPDYIGFVFAGKSRRYIPFEYAAELKKQLNPSITAVGVFVDEDVENVAKLLNDGIIDMAQLHGMEEDDYVSDLHRLTDRPLIKAYHISNRDELTKALKSQADYLLFDSSDAGSGRICDWSLLSHIDRPYFLAGGLNPDNITDALERLRPFAVDISSGVETDGHKDNGKIGKLVQLVSDWNQREQHN